MTDFNPIRAALLVMLHEARRFNAATMQEAGVGPFDLVAVRQAEAALAAPTPPVDAVPGEPVDDGQLDPRTAYEAAQITARYVESFVGQDWDASTIGNPDRMNLAQALDHLENISAMLLNQSERLRAVLATENSNEDLDLERSLDECAAQASVANYWSLPEQGEPVALAREVLTAVRAAHPNPEPGSIGAKAIAAITGLDHLAAPVASRAGSEPVAFMWQHDETGRTGFVAADFDRAHWGKHNPRLRIVSALYAAPIAPAAAAEPSDMVLVPREPTEATNRHLNLSTIYTARKATR